MLIKLDLSQNLLRSLVSLEPWSSLQQLHLQYNHLEQLPDGGFSSSGGLLLLLDISHKQLGSALPTNIFPGFTRLAVMDLSYSRLKEVEQKLLVLLQPRTEAAAVL